MSLATKYRPKTWDDVVEQDIVVKILKNICKEPELKYRNFLFTGPAGTGKAQPLYSKVITPKGYKTMGEIQVGDEVLDGLNKICKVTDVFPQGKRDIYEIITRDNSKIRVADNHLNVIGQVDMQECERYYRVWDTLTLIRKFNQGSSRYKMQIARRIGKEIKHEFITEINYIGKEDCKCIMVDSPSHTYLSDDNIITHNTTMARILANDINNGENSPIEVDAASHGNVDSIRELVEQARQYPVTGHYKIIILDEVHSVSNTGFQSLLKILEESPAKTVWCLCTTNPEKIPQTILSRVQSFQISKISLSGIINRLKYIIENENKEGRNIKYEDSAISYIAKLAQGGMRDAITLLDKALAYDKNVTLDNITNALGIPKYDDYFALLNAYVKHDNETIIDMIDKIYNSGVNFSKWFESWYGFIMNIVKFIFLRDINKTMIPAHYAEQISKYTTKHADICLKLGNRLVQLNHELKTTSFSQEMAITYLCR